MRGVMNFWNGKVAIVTGAGEGIGYRIALDLVDLGMTVVALDCARNKIDELEKLSKSLPLGKLVAFKCDVSNDKDLQHAFKAVDVRFGAVDLLVNNAAIGKAGFITTGDIRTFQHIINVNVYGLVACTRYTISSMKKYNVEGQIININSISGHYMPLFEEPITNVYVASKKMMTNFTKLLKNELKDTKIRVTSLSPGIVRTNLFATSGIHFINAEFFAKNPHLTTEDVSKTVLMVLNLPLDFKIYEIIFHALNEIY